MKRKSRTALVTMSVPVSTGDPYQDNETKTHGVCVLRKEEAKRSLLGGGTMA